MHTIDGGVLRVAIQLMFSVGFETDSWKAFGKEYTAAFLQRVEAFMDAWRPNISGDFARKPRAIKDIKFWKMRETNVAGVFMIPALIWAAGVKDELDHEYFENYMNLITAMRLVYNFSHKALPSVSMLINGFTNRVHSCFQILL